eukprot:7068934-Prymnesium_polylepis.1
MIFAAPPCSTFFTSRHFSGLRANRAGETAGRLRCELAPVRRGYRRRLQATPTSCGRQMR